MAFINPSKLSAFISGFRDKRLARRKISAAERFALANFSAQIMSSNKTSCFSAIREQMNSSRLRYSVDSMSVYPFKKELRRLRLRQDQTSDLQLAPLIPIQWAHRSQFEYFHLP